MGPASVRCITPASSRAASAGAFLIAAWRHGLTTCVTVALPVVTVALAVVTVALHMVRSEHAEARRPAALRDERLCCCAAHLVQA